MEVMGAVVDWFYFSAHDGRGALQVEAVDEEEPLNVLCHDAAARTPPGPIAFRQYRPVRPTAKLVDVVSTNWAGAVLVSERWTEVCSSLTGLQTVDAVVTLRGNVQSHGYRLLRTLEVGPRVRWTAEDIVDDMGGLVEVRGAPQMDQAPPDVDFWTPRDTYFTVVSDAAKRCMERAGLSGALLEHTSEIRVIVARRHLAP